MSTSTDHDLQNPTPKPRANARRAVDQLTVRARIEAKGLEPILDWIRSGATNREIAEKLNIHPATLCRYLNDDAHAQQYERAKADSAEALLDRGMEVLEQARGGDTAEVQRARALAQEYARRAGIRNARYSERAAVELTGPNGGPLQTQPQVVVYLPDNGRQRHNINGDVISENGDKP